MKNPLVSFLILITFLFQNSSLGQCEKDNYLAKSNSSTINYKKFNINNLSTFIYNDGRADINGANAGFQFPKKSNKYAIYISGFLLGGISDGAVSVCGAHYASNLSVGEIDENWLQNSWDSTGIYRVRPDYNSVDFSEEAEDEFTTTETVALQYENDWNYWPANKGAPYQDLNSDGIYDPETDIPGYPGADQTLWYVANAADSAVTKTLFQSPPLDVEVQVTVWGFKNETYLDNVLFKKYILINKGQKEINDMYFSQFSDPDIGGAGDDFAGCDTNLQLGYAYNGEEQDVYYSNYPPAIGFQVLKGAGKDWGNLGMTSFVYWICMPYTEEYSCPHTDEYQGALDIYNYMQGKMLTGEHIKIPEELGNGNIKYRAPGDPVNGSGWLDGVYEDPTSDRYILMSTGPFNLAPGETQEIIVAQMATGGVEGVDHIQAVAELKEIASQLQIDYGMVSDVEKEYEIPSDIQLYQNYPNPFNPSTNIEFYLPEREKVELIIYDLLGRKITTLLDEEAGPGKVMKHFDASKVATGVYFYELKTSNYSQQRKMILLK